MKLLDTYCKGGGASMGYYRAGFDVTGVDIEPQPRYPFKFFQGDAVEFILEHGHEYDVIVGSPPCQFGSKLTPVYRKPLHKNWIPATRAAMITTGKPYIIENVESARKHLINPVMLCGTMFGLPIFRHRYFENNFGLVMSPFTCHHDFEPVLVSGVMKRKGQPRREHSKREKAEAIGIDWMVGAELDEAIPPAYTEWLGRQLLELLRRAA